MKTTKPFFVVLSGVVAVALTGCVSTGGGAGGGGAGGGGASGYDAAFDAATAKVPTTDMPTRLQADYAGQFKAAVNDGAAAGITGDVEVVGDLDVAVNWTDGQAANPFSGTASNITVTDNTSGASEVLEGSLTVDNGIGGTIARTTIPPMNIGGITTPEVNTGSFQFGMSGGLSGTEGDVEATVLIGGNFHGPQGETMVGVVSGGFSEVGSTNPAIFDAAIGGTAYLDQQ